VSGARVAVHYVRIGEPPLELILDEADRAYVAEAGRASVALRRATSRSFLRRVLAHELDARGEAIGIDRDRSGRPRLRQRRDLDFSVSNTKTLVAVAVCGQGRVGLDIEPEGRPGLRRWTLWEALLKEAGLGLATPPGAVVEAPREFASLRHAGHRWAIVRRGRSGEGVLSIQRWHGGVPRQERTERLSPYSGEVSWGPARPCLGGARWSSA
jgi:hypothetical protein